MASFNGNDVIISGSLIVSGSSKILEVPRWDYDQVLTGVYPPAGSVMEIVNFPEGGSGLYYSTGTSFYAISRT